MMGKQELEQFAALRKKVSDYILGHTDADMLLHCNESWELNATYPGIFEEEGLCRITLYSRMLSPNRKTDWFGKDWAEAIVRCEHDINRWLEGGSQHE